MYACTSFYIEIDPIHNEACVYRKIRCYSVSFPFDRKPLHIRISVLGTAALLNALKLGSVWMENSNDWLQSFFASALHHYLSVFIAFDAASARCSYVWQLRLLRTEGFYLEALEN